MSELGSLIQWDNVHANDLASAGSLIQLRDYLSACFGDEIEITVEIDDDADFWITQWEVLGASRSRLVLGRTLDGLQQERLQWRIFNIIPLIAKYLREGTPTLGKIAINLEDFGITPGLAFCEYRPEYFLIPDPDFIGTEGYAVARHVFSTATVPWKERAPIVFWRGSDFGHRIASWRELPRVQLCEIARGHSALFDVGISDIRHGIFAEEIKASGLMRDHVPTANFNRYRAHVDIDGRTNAWSGLFYKLFSGSPVLKVESPFGYRQWYYDRLKPWVNFVPVASDMSDLVENAIWLHDHDDAARQIGENGRALAMSLTYDGELTRACHTISAALRFLSDLPEVSISFPAEGSDNKIYAPLATGGETLGSNEPTSVTTNQGGFMPSDVETPDGFMKLLHETSPYEGFCAAPHPDDTQGWGSDDPIFEEIIRAVEPRIIVEVGSWKGASAIHMAKIVKSLGLNTRIICIDTWLGSPEHFLGTEPAWRASLRLKHGFPELYFTFLANVVRHGVQDVIIPLPSTSESGAVILERRGIRPDLVYIDAAHEYEPVLRDLRTYWRLMTDSGILLGDDYIGWAGVTRAANEFAAEVRSPIFGKLGKFIIPRGGSIRVKISVE